MLAGSDRVLFGAAYYHEYQPYDRLDVDLDLMQEPLGPHALRELGEEDLDGDFSLMLAIVCEIDGGSSRFSTVPRGGASPSSLARPRMPCRRGWPGCIRKSPANDPRANGSLGGLGRKSISRTQPSSSMPTG